MITLHSNSMFIFGSSSISSFTSLNIYQRERESEREREREREEQEHKNKDNPIHCLKGPLS